MTEGSPAYRARAAFVRGAARDHLRQLREERLAAREAARAQEAAADPVVAEAAAAVEPEVEAPVAAATQAPVAAAEEAPAASVVEAPATPVPEAPATEPAAALKAAPEPPPANPRLPLSPGMRRMLQARVSAQPAAEPVSGTEPEGPPDVPEGPVAGGAPEAESACAAPEQVMAAENGATAAAVEPEPSPQPDRAVAAVEDAALPEAPIEDSPDHPEPVPEVSAVAPVPAAAAAMAPALGAPDPVVQETAPSGLAAPETSAPERALDLARLPGAGPGLIWMLNECEIHSLSDLAAADCTDLTARMGLAGRILDLGGWIAFARAAEAR